MRQGIEKIGIEIIDGGMQFKEFSKIKRRKEVKKFLKEKKE